MQISTAIRISMPVHNSGHSYLVHRKRIPQISIVTQEVIRLVSFWFENGFVSSTGRVIVFVEGNVDRIETMASTAGGNHFHGQMGPDQKVQALARFRHPEPSEVDRLLFCSSALGCGVNLPEVEAVIHVGVPDDMICFLQEVGRAGRGGARGISYIFPMKGSSTVTKEDYTGERAIADYAQPADASVCRRRTISEFMNGEADDCFTGSVASCDVCCLAIGRPSILVPPAVGGLTVRERAGERTVLSVKRPLSAVTGRVEQRVEIPVRAVERQGFPPAISKKAWALTVSSDQRGVR
jgi:hypothetical protein